jgi:hypothetical protein
VEVALVLSAASSGALAGLAAGLLWWATGAPAITGPAALAVVIAAVVLDLAWRRWRRPRPLSIGTQVPQAWGRILAPATAATLYGLRLGVGPLTILNTWRWWAGAVVGASLGPAQAAAAGAVFGALRTVITLVVAAGAEQRMPERMARVRDRERAVRPILASAAVLVAAVVLVACSGGSSPDRARSTTTTTRAATTTSTAVAPEPLDEVLAAVLIDVAPSGYEPVDGAAGEGALDLAAAAHQSNDETAERALLETRRFVRGYQRRWGHGDDLILARVLQFAGPAEAAAYMQDGLITLDGFGAVRFDVPGVDGAAAFSLVSEDAEGGHVSHGTAFTRGDRFFLVVVTGSADLTPDDARSLASQQAARAQ